MVAVINTNSQDLERVKNTIHQSNQEIQNAIQRINSTMSSAQWNDPVRKRFDVQHQALRQSVKSFDKEAQEAVRYLAAKIQKLQEYSS